MTQNDFARISESMHNDMMAAGAGIMDYYTLAKMVAGIALIELSQRGADDTKIMEAIDMMTDSLRTDMRSAWADIKTKCIVQPNAN